MIVGPATAGEVVTFGEIEAWQRQTGRQLSAWEVEMINRLSRSYLSEYHQAQEPGRAPPGGVRSAPAERPQFGGLWAALERMERQDRKRS